MGNGASKDPTKGASSSSTAVETLNATAEEAEDAALEEEFQQQLQQKRQQQQQQQQKSSWGGGIWRRRNDESDKKKKQNSKGKVKVVGLVDSDDEVEDERSKVRSTSLVMENDLDESDDIRELEELDRTFRSIGIPATNNNDRIQRPPRQGERSLASSDQSVASGFVTSASSRNQQQQNSVSHTRFGPGTTVGRRPSLVVSGRRPSVITQQQQQQQQFRGGAKLSWDGGTDSAFVAPVEKESEEWTYKRTVIEGFDPDKFRQVNKGVGSVNSVNNSANVRRMPPPSSTAMSAAPAALPGAVMDSEAELPTYDSSEQQLMASLERELGVV